MKPMGGGATAVATPFAFDSSLEGRESTSFGPTTDLRSSLEKVFAQVPIDNGTGADTTTTPQRRTLGLKRPRPGSFSEGSGAQSAKNSATTTAGKWFRSALAKLPLLGTLISPTGADEQSEPPPGKRKREELPPSGAVVNPSQSVNASPPEAGDNDEVFVFVPQTTSGRRQRFSWMGQQQQLGSPAPPQPNEGEEGFGDLPRYHSVSDEEKDLEYILSVREKYGLPPLECLKPSGECSSPPSPRTSRPRPAFSMPLEQAGSLARRPLGTVRTYGQTPLNAAVPPRPSYFAHPYYESEHQELPTPYDNSANLYSRLRRPKRALKSADYRKLLRQAKFHPCKWVDYFDYVRGKKLEEQEELQAKATPAPPKRKTVVEDEGSIAEEEKHTSFTLRTAPKATKQDQLPTRHRRSRGGTIIVELEPLGSSDTEQKKPQEEELLKKRTPDPPVPKPKETRPETSDTESKKIETQPKAPPSPVSVPAKEKTTVQEKEDKLPTPLPSLQATETPPKPKWWEANIGKPNLVPIEEDSSFAPEADETEKVKDEGREPPTQLRPTFDASTAATQNESSSQGTSYSFGSSVGKGLFQGLSQGSVADTPTPAPPAEKPAVSLFQMPPHPQSAPKPAEPAAPTPAEPKLAFDFTTPATTIAKPTTEAPVSSLFGQPSALAPTDKKDQPTTSGLFGNLGAKTGLGTGTGLFGTFKTAAEVNASTAPKPTPTESLFGNLTAPAPPTTSLFASLGAKAQPTTTAPIETSSATPALTAPPAVAPAPSSVIPPPSSLGLFGIPPTPTPPATAPASAPAPAEATAPTTTGTALPATPAPGSVSPFESTNANEGLFGPLKGNGGIFGATKPLFGQEASAGLFGNTSGSLFGGNGFGNIGTPTRQEQPNTAAASGTPQQLFGVTSPTNFKSGGLFSTPTNTGAAFQTPSSALFNNTVGQQGGLFGTGSTQQQQENQANPFLPTSTFQQPSGSKRGKIKLKRTLPSTPQARN